MPLKAKYQLKRNIDAILKARRQSQKDLALACGRTESWMSNIFTKADREIPLKYLDDIAAFFGLAPYQLFQPGISAETERRSGKERRSRRDRRVSDVADVRDPVGSLADLQARVKHFSPDEYRRWLIKSFAAAQLSPEPESTSQRDLREGETPQGARAKRTRRRR